MKVSKRNDQPDFAELLGAVPIGALRNRDQSVPVIGVALCLTSGRKLGKPKKIRARRSRYNCGPIKRRAFGYTAR